MDSNTPTSSNTGSPAVSTAETLRALQERAKSALAAQRARMGQLENQLTSQLDSISAAISDQLAGHSDSELQTTAALAEIATVRQELADVRAAWAREKELSVADVTNREQLVEKQRAELDARAEELTISRRDLESRQLALDDRATQLNGRERELRRTHEELESRTQDAARQQSQLAAAEAQLEQSRTDLTNRESKLQSIEQSLTAREAALQLSQQQAALNQINLSEREASWQTERAAIERERDQLQTQLTQLSQDNLSHGSELAAQLTEARRQLAAQQIAAEAEHTTAESERASLQKELAAAVEARDALSAQLAGLNDQGQTANAQLASQVAEAQQQLASQQSAWDAERLALRQERDVLSSALNAAGEQLANSSPAVDMSAERDALQQKLELVLADVQRLRSRNAELEQELASRPEPDQKESVDLVRLRGERDALAERVAELEQQPAAVVDSDAAQQISDLQRRFELAVEDVRDLKKQNTQLEAQLEEQAAATKSAPPAAAGAASGNWEAVKKQLLASLEGEAIDAEPARQKEISTIENTIHITDEIVANKDRQIAELKLKITSGLGVEDGGSPAAEGLEAALDADAIIQKHRTRIAEIEQQMEAKLRETEMQLSLERAKIAREQSQLAELRIELDAMRGPNGPTADAGGGNAPKRRWLSKLGLGEEEKEKK